MALGRSTPAPPLPFISFTTPVQNESKNIKIEICVACVQYVYYKFLSLSLSFYPVRWPREIYNPRTNGTMARLIYFSLNKIIFTYFFFFFFSLPIGLNPLKKKIPSGFGYFHDKHVTTVNNNIPPWSNILSSFLALKSEEEKILVLFG